MSYISYEFDELLDAIKIAVRKAQREGDSFWIEAFEDVAEIEEDATDEDVIRLQDKEVPELLKEVLKKAGLDCEIYRSYVEPGLLPEYMALCQRKGRDYTILFDVTLDPEDRVIRVLGVRAYKGRASPHPYYKSASW